MRAVKAEGVGIFVPMHSFPSMKLPPETRHALSLQQLRAFVQPVFVFDENVPAKIPVQTPLLLFAVVFSFYDLFLFLAPSKVFKT